MGSVDRSAVLLSVTTSPPENPGLFAGNLRRVLPKEAGTSPEMSEIDGISRYPTESVASPYDSVSCVGAGSGGY